MVLQELFKENGYSNIINKVEALQYELAVNMFYDDEEKIPEELRYLYISKTRDELFFVLDTRKYTPSELCEKWDRKISAFMTFGSQNREIIRKLKYNTVQILLYEAPIADRSEESSLNISRKILMPCTFKDDGTIEIPDDEVVGIPFYLITKGDFETNIDVVDKLRDCLSGTESDNLDFLNLRRKQVQRRTDENNHLRKNFEEDEYNKIKEWLNTNVNTND